MVGGSEEFFSDDDDDDDEEAAALTSTTTTIDDDDGEAIPRRLALRCGRANEGMLRWCTGESIALLLSKLSQRERRDIAFEEKRKEGKKEEEENLDAAVWRHKFFFFG